MSRRITTIFDHAFPDTPEWNAITEAWPADVVKEMLTLVWEGFDQMKSGLLSRVDFSQPLNQLERTLTDSHATAITLLWKANSGGFGSFLPKHEAWEPTGIENPSAMPPSYDIGFENVNDPRLRWPVEAKVLGRPSDVQRYLGDLRVKYLKGVGAPFSTQAALVGYLREGEPVDVILTLQSQPDMDFKPLPLFRKRFHYITEHPRSVPGINNGSAHQFICHHLIAPLISK